MRAASPPARVSRTSTPIVSPGVMIAVCCADPARLSVLLASAERSMQRAGRPAFIKPLISGPCADGLGDVVSPNRFRDLEAANDLLVSWTDGIKRIAYDRRPIEQIVMGHDVVIGIPTGREEWLRRAWPTTRLVRIASGTEVLRQRLAPRATFSRSVFSASTADPALALEDVAITDTGDIATAIRSLTRAIEALLPERLQPPNLAVVPRQSRAPRGPKVRPAAHPIPPLPLVAHRPA